MTVACQVGQKWIPDDEHTFFKSGGGLFQNGLAIVNDFFACEDSRAVLECGSASSFVPGSTTCVLPAVTSIETAMQLYRIGRIFLHIS